MASVGIPFLSSHDKYQPQKITTKPHNLDYSQTTIGKKSKASIYLLNIQPKKVDFLFKKVIKYFKLYYIVL